MRWTWCVLVGVLANCDSGAPDCAKAIAPTTMRIQPGDARMLIGGLLTKSCEASWSGAQRTCVAAATTWDGVMTCVPDLGPQAEALKAKIAELKAVAERDQALADAKAAADKLAKLATELDALNDKVSKAVDAVMAAQSDADRATATATLKDLRKDKAELETRIAEAKADAERAERSKGVHISKECLENPLAKGCQ